MRKGSERRGEGGGLGREGAEKDGRNNGRRIKKPRFRSRLGTQHTADCDSVSVVYNRWYFPVISADVFHPHIRAFIVHKVQHIRT